MQTAYKKLRKICRQASQIISNLHGTWPQFPLEVSSYFKLPCLTHHKLGSWLYASAVLWPLAVEWGGKPSASILLKGSCSMRWPHFPAIPQLEDVALVIQLYVWSYNHLLTCGITDYYVSSFSPPIYYFLICICESLTGIACRHLRF